MKRIRLRVISFLMLSAVLVSASLARPAHQVPAESLDAGPGSTFELPAGKTQISLPFQLVNNHVILPIKVNGAGPFQVILDTGMPVEGLLLYSSDKVEALHLAYLDSVEARVGGVGGKGEDRAARIAAEVALEVGDLKIANARATVLTPEPGFAVYHDGIIGASLFNHFAVSLDYDRSLLTLSTPEAYRPPEGATSLPLTLEHGRAYVPAAIGIGGEAIPVSLVLDLGASHVVSLNEKPESHLVAPKGSITASIGRGMSGIVMGQVARIRFLKLASLELPSVVATFPEKAHASVHGVDFHDGNLGDGALRRFNLTVDYSGGRLILQPNKSFSEPFEWDMTGFQAEPTGDGSVRVSRVLPGSPAAQAGIQEADRLLRIAGEQVTEQ